MPAVPPPAKVLVTGANGYIAIWVVKLLIQEGYTVRATVRSARKGEHLVKYFNPKEYGDNKLEVVVVEDITKEGAFDEAVKGVDAIEHTASPFIMSLEDPQEFIGPAVEGTVGILKSALKHGSSVKRIIVTGSCAAVMAPPPKPTVFTENDWNTESLKDVEANGIKANVMSKYRSSKVLAEKATWNFVEEHKNEIKWDLVVINPPFVFGPPIHEITGGPETLNTSLKQFYDVVVRDGEKSQDLLATSNAWVDVRDAAQGHILGLQKESAGGERIIVSAGSFIWQEWLDAANTIDPYPLPHHPAAKGIPGLDKIYNIQYNTEKEKRLFGIKFKTPKESAHDALVAFALKGW